jgi:hypothetical protein
MHAIALLIAVAATAQTPPPLDPPSLEPGEKSYEIKIDEDTYWYVRGFPRELELSNGFGKFESDELARKFVGRTRIEFLDYREEFSDEREKRWREEIDAWYRANGYVPDESVGWVKEESKQWSDRARTAALQVIQEREELESQIAEVPKLSATETENPPQPGFIQLWGPQLGVGALALILMGIVVRMLFLPDGTGWQKID